MLNTSIRLWNESSGKITVQESYQMLRRRVVEKYCFSLKWISSVKCAL